MRPSEVRCAPGATFPSPRAALERPARSAGTELASVAGELVGELVKGAP